MNSGLRRAVDSLSSEARENGIGEAFKTLAEAGLSLGLYPRVEASSILFAAQNDKRFCLYTIWVKPVRGLLRVYVQSTKFVEVLRIDPALVESILGSDGYREFSEIDAQQFSSALRSLIGPVA
jgi:hypothetical protein